MRDDVKVHKTMIVVEFGKRWVECECDWRRSGDGSGTVAELQRLLEIGREHEENAA